ncbi:MAG: hypothetical protein KDI46_00210 [Alphaproteobacteria bacterium]|nr:hypothetical protein [Alphaproteobacteria bacterium]
MSILGASPAATGLGKMKLGQDKGVMKQSFNERSGLIKPILRAIWKKVSQVFNYDFAPATATVQASAAPA